MGLAGNFYGLDAGASMTGFAVDHVVIRTPGRDGFVRAVAQACGLVVLHGFSQGDVVHSMGVRFANGPFFDAFEAETPTTALILGGAVDEAERLAEAQDWAARFDRRETRPKEHPPFPWSMALFRRGQGLLTQVSVIEYAAEAEAWADPDFSGPLYRRSPDATARLSRVWLSTGDLGRAERDLAALGFVASGEVSSAFWPRAGRSLSGPAADLVLFEGLDTVARLDIATGGAAREIVLSDAPRLVLDEDL
jgi:hypothetical protein